jgi:purine-binding chemotaxis protein CheW
MFGLPITAVSQIIEIVAITHLPQLPKGIQGAINVHGRIVPVIDLRRRFGLECAPYHLHTPMILAEADDRMLALIVDMVDDVVTVTPTAVNNLPAHTPSLPCLAEQFQLGHEVVPVLDIQHLLSHDEQAQLARLLPSTPSRNGLAKVSSKQ